MTKTTHFLPKATFDSIYGTVPRLTVEVIVRLDGGVVLTKRAIEPCLGQWHLPGGTVRFGESLEQAVRRVAYDELGIGVEPGKLLGYIEYPQMLADGYRGWPVGIAFEAVRVSGQLRGSDQGEEVASFTELPDNVIAEQAAFLRRISI